MKKILTLAMICATVLTVLSIPISAKTVTYDKPSSLYKNSVYYRSLTSVYLTGDERHDVIAIAVSQLYYHEGNSTSDLAGFNTNGDQNFTEYNYSYGKLDQNGDGKLTYGYPWCAAFVSFCLRRAGVSTTVAPSHVNCTTWLNLFKKGSSNYSYYARGSYKPLMGDIVFYRSASTSRASDHVGLVIGTSGDRLFAIEGNTSDGVYIKSYKLSDTYIVGYAVPKYKSSIKSSALSGKYVVNAESSLNLRSGPSKEYSVITSLKNGTSLTLHRIEGDWAYVTANSRTGWISTKYLAPIEAYRVKVSVNYGKSKFDFFALYGASVSIPAAEKKSGYTFEGFKDQNGKRYSADKAVSFKSNTVLSPVYVANTSKPETEAPKLETTRPPSASAKPETSRPPSTTAKPDTMSPPSTTKAPEASLPPSSDTPASTERLPEEITLPESETVPETESEAESETESGGEPIESETSEAGSDSSEADSALQEGCASSVSFSLSFVLILGVSLILTVKKAKR